MSADREMSGRDTRTFRHLAAWFNGVGAGVGVALRALWANKLRAALTALGIVIGVTTVIGILAIIHGLNTSFQQQMSRLGVRTLYVDKMPWMSRHDWFVYRNRPPIADWQYRRLRTLVPFAEAMAPLENEMGKVERGDDQINDVSVRGTNSEYLQIQSVAIERGRFFSPPDVEYQRPYAVLGSEVAAKLFEREDPLMKHVWINGMKYVVIGVLKSLGSFLGRSQDAVVLIPLGCFRRSYGLRHSMGVGVRVAEEVDLETAQEELRGIMRRVRGLRPAEEDNFAVNQQQMLSDMYRNLTGTLYLVMVIVSFISLLVGGIGIMNIMLVSVIERTKEIGIRKALGARRRTMLFQFLIESVVLSALGGIIGIALGFLAAYLVEAITPLPASLSVGAVLAGLGFSALVGISFGLYPANRASRMDPIESLRYE